MIEAAGRQILMGVVVEQSAVGFELVDQEIVDCVLARGQTGHGADRQALLKGTGAGLRGKNGNRAISVVQARYVGVSRGSDERGDNCLLGRPRVGWSKIRRYSRRGPGKDRAVGQEHYRVLRVLAQSLKRNKQERLILLDGGTQRAPKLVSAERILDRPSLRSKGEWISRPQRFAARKWVCCVHGIVSEIAEKTAVYCVSARFRYNVDRASESPSLNCAVIATIHLEFLYRILADSQSDAACVIIRLRAVHGYTIAAAIAPVKRKATLGRLLDTKILIVGKTRGIRDTRHQQGKR